MKLAVSPQNQQEFWNSSWVKAIVANILDLRLWTKLKNIFMGKDVILSTLKYLNQIEKHIAFIKKNDIKTEQ